MPAIEERKVEDLTSFMQGASPTKVTWSDEGSKHVLPEQSEGTPPVTLTSNVASGYVGEMFGALRSGTGGFTYSARSTTTLSSSLTVAVSVTLNKGIYLISGQLRCFQSSGTNRVAYTGIFVGGTSVTSESETPMNTATNWSWTQPATPIVVTSDNTVVGIYGYVTSLVGSTSSGVHEIFAIRIA